MKNKSLQIGDEILITDTTLPGVAFIGTIGIIKEIDLYEDDGYKFRILMGRDLLYWGNGVAPTDLSKALL